MSSFTVLEVAIGLVLIYATLSVFCSALSEWFSRLFELRASTLKSAINTLLQDPAAQGLAGELHKHPLIAGLYLDKKTYATYIPSKIFAMALYDLAVGSGPPTPGATQVQLLPKVLPPTQLLLRSILHGVGVEPTAVQARLASWFDDSMERVSGWYKRKTQLILIIIATCVTLALNVDTIQITKTLWVDPTVRAALVQRAETLTRDSTIQSGKYVSRYQQELDGLQTQLPLGWDSCAVGARCVSHYLWAALHSVPGFLLTVLALGMGAPFWFDLLNKLVNLRQTGVPPDEQKSK